MDIGGTLIGMHRCRIAAPVRIKPERQSYRAPELGPSIFAVPRQLIKDNISAYSQKHTI